MVVGPVEGHVAIDDEVVLVIGFDDEFAEDGVEGGGFLGDDHGPVAVGVDVGLLIGVEGTEVFLGVEDELGEAFFTEDDGAEGGVFLEGGDEGLAFLGVDGGDDGEVEVGGEVVDGVVCDFGALVGDDAVVEVEEVEGAAAFVGGDVGGGFLDVFFEDDLDITLAVESGAFGADPAVENEGGGFGDGVEEELVEAEEGGEEGTDAHGVAGKVGLWDDLTEEGDADGGEDEAADAEEDGLGEEGEEDVDADVSPEDGAEEEVGVTAQGEDFAGGAVSFFDFGFEAQASQGEKGEVAAGEDSGL